ncbi:MAG TPA: hypothetical protein VH914_01640 [Acidimicrobiia bacterium]|nr:hypothetical protein [Acidimicrobiia bacterium]
MRTRRVVAGAVVLALIVALAACGGDDDEPNIHAAKSVKPGDVSAAQYKEAARLVNVGGLKSAPPATIVRCVAKTVVENPLLDQVANDIAQIENKDLRQAVMFAYLLCGYNYIVDTYMRFAPPGMSKPDLKCVRSKFTQLPTQSLAEVIVEDPDAGYTGPLVIQACKSGSKANPLLKNGQLIGMGGS